MSVTLRVTLIVGAFLFVLLVFSTVNRKKLQMGDSLLWLLVSVLLIIVAIFPQLCVWASQLIGIETPSNFIYLICIAALFALVFHLTVKQSSMERKTRRLIQTISIDRYLREKEDRKSHE